jgi:hypothetical protein
MGAKRKLTALNKPCRRDHHTIKNKKSASWIVAPLPFVVTGDLIMSRSKSALQRAAPDASSIVLPGYYSWQRQRTCVSRFNTSETKLTA